MKERKVFTKVLCERSRRASKRNKGKILDELVETAEYNRCYARWVLRNHGRRVYVAPAVRVEGDMKTRLRRPRCRTYGEDVLKPLKRVWEILDYLGGKRLAAAMPEVLPRLIAHKEIRLKAALRDKLLAMSPATIDRLLKPVRERYALKGRSHTKPGTLLIPDCIQTHTRRHCEQSKAVFG